MAKHLMVVGGHISDPENMAGAVMLKHKRAGWGVTIVNATTGEKGHPNLSAEAYLEMRLADARASGEYLGANVENLPFRDGELVVDDHSIWLLADLIRKYRPDLVITHWRGSFHQDHNATHDLVHKALFRAGLPAFERDLPAHRPARVLYSENWEDMENYSADIYLDVTDVFDEYLELLNTHALMREGYSSFRYIDYYQALGQMRGCLGGFGKAVTLMRPPGIYSYSREAGLLLSST